MCMVDKWKVGMYGFKYVFKDRLLDTWCRLHLQSLLMSARPWRTRAAGGIFDRLPGNSFDPWVSSIVFFCQRCSANLSYRLAVTLVVQ